MGWDVVEVEVEVKKKTCWRKIIGTVLVLPASILSVAVLISLVCCVVPWTTTLLVIIIVSFFVGLYLLGVGEI